MNVDSSQSAKPDPTRDTIEREHERLLILLEHTRDALRDDHTQRDEVAGAMRALQECLQAHIQVEEGKQGFLNDVLNLAPQAVSEIEQIRREHGDMLRELDELAAVCMDTGKPDWMREVRRRFTKFAEILLAHERHEQALLQEAYSRDIGSND